VVYLRDLSERKQAEEAPKTLSLKDSLLFSMTAGVS
jgi:hypothetical protein